MSAIARTLLRLLGRVPIALALLLMAAGGCRDADAQSVSYRVIVNAANPVTQLKRDDVSRLFLKKVVSWKAGGEVQPVDQAESSPVRRSFTKDVHKKDVEQVKGYWQQLIFTGQGAPPIEKGSDDEVVAFIAKTPAAIGYVSSTTTLGSGVKAIQILP
jgi:ABC-type phosphate transport system substrate-binding protein